MSSRFGIIFGAVALGAAFAVPAQAIPTNGTIGFVPIGAVTYVGSSLSTATSITFSGLQVVNVVPPTYLGMPNVFFSGPGSVALGSMVNLNPITIDVPSPKGVLVSDVLPDFLNFGPTLQFHFSLANAVATSSAVNALHIDGYGTFHDSSGILDDQVADVSFGFTQTGAVNFSGTFEAPPAPISEPVSIVLVASGLIALGGFRLRKARSTVKVATMDAVPDAEGVPAH